MTQAFPLKWPAHRTRTPAHQRKRAAFSKVSSRTVAGYGNGDSFQVQDRRSLTVADAVERLLNELRLLGARGAVISANLELRNDGLPRSGQRPPDDPGVAIYFHLGKNPMVMACDRWDRVADNIAAVAGHIDALRRTDRYGVVDQAEAFAGFTALPPPIITPAEKPWRVVLGLEPNEQYGRDLINQIRRDAARHSHPDKGGDHADMAEINAACDAALRELAA
jgi:hypothetical protein